MLKENKIMIITMMINKYKLSNYKFIIQNNIGNFDKWKILNFPKV